MNPLEAVRLLPLMERSSGSPRVAVGIIDGPVAMDHPDLAAGIRDLSRSTGACSNADSAACLHGTFVAGILCAKRGSPAPGICPDCTFLVRPVSAESTSANGPAPSSTPEDLAEAIVECVEAGARILNLSLGLIPGASHGEPRLEEALHYAARRAVLLVAAAGNQGTLGSTTITRHPWVIPVTACDRRGRPMSESNIGRSIGRRGLGAPGDGVTSLGGRVLLSPCTGPVWPAPFVTGAIALLWLGCIRVG